MKILKFGGTSVRDAERMKIVAQLVAAEVERSREVAVVVSAISGATDALERAATDAAHDLVAATRIVDALGERHQEILAAVASGEERSRLETLQESHFDELRAVLRGISLLRECSTRTRDRILSFGERSSAPLVAVALRARGLDAEPADARELVVTDARHGSARVLTEKTNAKLRAHFANASRLQVVTGFLGATEDGETTTLGRGGSDLSAALLGAALKASEVQIWTDVDGVLTADPRLVPHAFSLEAISYEELLELSHFGAKVVFPPTVGPARRAGIPLVIKNTLNPSFPGTRVVERLGSAPAVAAPAGAAAEGSGNVPSQSRGRPTFRPVTGISSMSHLSMLRLEGVGMVAVPGFAGRLFHALALAEVSVILISQASSEHSICFAVAPEDAETARAAMEREFALERELGLIQPPVVEHDLAVVAVVGEGMRERPGISGRIFAELGRHDVNVRAITQGSSELNISLVVGKEDQRTAVKTIHESFFRDLDHRIELLVVGAGRVGSALLRQIHRLRQDRRLDLEIEVCGLVNSSRQWLDHQGLDLAMAQTTDDWRRALATRGEPIDPEQVRNFLRDGSGQRALVDCTASADMCDLYLDSMDQGLIVVSANKLPFASDLRSYRRLRQARRAFGRGLYYETTVGAGLPVLRTLRSMIDSGDRVIRIEGTFSGTLGLLLSALRDEQRFSTALLAAHEGGYTEPDPREDLSGRDVARKLLILARDAGLNLELDDVELEPFVDTGSSSLALEQFWNELGPADDELAERQRAAAARGQVLVYRALLENGAARVGLETVDPDHPLAQVEGTDNLFAFYTERYRETPLVVRGPGAGTEVTAAGVLGDLLQAHAEASPAVLLRRPADMAPESLASHLLAPPVGAKDRHAG